MPIKKNKKEKVPNPTADRVKLILESMMPEKVKLSKNERVNIKNTVVKYQMLKFAFYTPVTMNTIVDYHYTKVFDIPKSIIKDAVEELALDGDLEVTRKKCKNGHTVSQYMTSRTRIYVQADIENVKCHDKGIQKFKRKYQSVQSRPYGFVVLCNSQRSIFNRIKYLIFGD